MKVTEEFLREKKACREGVYWVRENNLIGLKPVPFLNKLIEYDKLDWANWLIVRVMERKQYLAYAIFAAEQVLDIYEKKNPNDKRPRKAIEAAKAVLKNDTKKNRADAAAAAADAYAADAAYADAAYAADAAAAAADADAAYAADAAAAAADAYAAAAAAAADAYADAAYAAYAAARRKMRLKILNYGIELLENKQ